jgi:hypothetical protein
MADANAARVSIVSGVLFVLLLGSLHLLEPEFNPSWRFLSEYELGKFGWLMRLAFLALATSLASAGLAVFSQARTAIGYIGIAGLGIAAVGIVIAAIFRIDPATTSREAATFSGRMHVFGASLDYTPVAALLSALAWLATLLGGRFASGCMSPLVLRGSRWRRLWLRSHTIARSVREF